MNNYDTIQIMDRLSLETSHERKPEYLVDESRFNAVLNELIFMLHEKRKKYIGDRNIEGVIAANNDIKYLQNVIYPVHKTC